MDIQEDIPGVKNVRCSIFLRKKACESPWLSGCCHTEDREGDERKYLNSDSVCEGLELLRKKNPDESIYIILDNAAYQRCKKVKHCAECLNINLIFSSSVFSQFESN